MWIEDPAVERAVESEDQRPLDQATLGLVLLAIGDSLVGAEIARACGLPRSAAREIGIRQVLAVLRGKTSERS